MQKVEVLFRLQTLDLEADEKARRLQEVEARLGESEELLAARASVADCEEAIRQTEADLRDHEMQANSLDAKLKDSNKKLYGGKSRSSRELSDLQKEAEHLLRQKGKEEDAELDAMGRLEELQAELKVRRQDLAAIQEAWRQEQENLKKEQALLQSELGELGVAREEVARVADPSYMTTYEALRRQKGGRAVVRVEQNLCSGCRIMIAMGYVQKARNAESLTFCSSCGRILYVPR